MTESNAARRAGMSDAAVLKATGRKWSAWFSRLEKAGARGMNHREIVAWLDAHELEMSGWWMQMVTVAYEQARGLRARHEKPDGFEVSVGRTLGAPVPSLFAAWNDPKKRKRWLPEAVVIHKATRDKSMRVTWIDGAKSISVYFYPKAGGRAQVVVQHGRLRSARDAASAKRLWADRLEALREIVET